MIKSWLKFNESVYHLNESNFSDLENKIYLVPEGGYPGIPPQLKKFVGKFISPVSGSSVNGNVDVSSVKEFEKQGNAFNHVGEPFINLGGDIIWDETKLKVVGKV